VLITGDSAGVPVSEADNDEAGEFVRIVALSEVAVGCRELNSEFIDVVCTGGAVELAKGVED